MKKLMLSLAVCFSAFQAAQAYSITFYNNTGVPFTFGLGGTNPVGSPVSGFFTYSAPVNGWGSTVYTDPTTVPGMPAYALSTGQFDMLWGICSPFDIAVGRPGLGSPSSVQTFDASNSCYNGTPFSITWYQTSLGDNIVLIN